MPINRADARAITVQVADDLRRRIAEGEFAADQRFPSLRALAGEYEVAELTAHAAVKALQAEGLLVSAPGRGTYVRAASERVDGQPTELGAELAALRGEVEAILRRLDELERSQEESRS